MQSIDALKIENKKRAAGARRPRAGEPAAAASLDEYVVTIAFRSDVATLQAFSPLGVLERGYAIVRRPDGSVISRTSDVTPQQPLRIRVRDGEFDAKSL